MRKIFLIAGLLAVSGNPVAFGQDHSAQTAEDIAAKQANDQRLKAELGELKSYLKEAHEGKRDETERYVILHRMLQDYGLLRSTGTAEAQAAIQEWHELLKAHPEFRAHPPRLEIREQREAREREEKIEAERKAKLAGWTPADSRPTNIYGLGGKAVAEFQYKLEFFHLTGNLKIAQETDKNKVFQAINDGRIVPIKTMTFKSIIVGPWTPSEPFNHPLWFCTDPTAKYVGMSADERAAIGLKGKHWTNSKADYDQFCGAVSMDGDVIFRLPFKESYPDQLLKVLQLAKDGKTAVIGVGKAMGDPVDGDMEIVPSSEIVIWQYPDRTETIPLSDRAAARKALLAHGLSPVVIGERP